MRLHGLLLVGVFLLSELTACTGLMLKSEDHSVVSGRTVEFAVELEMSTAVIPRKHQFVGESSGGNGLKYTSKYAAVGIYCFEDQKLMDGINEKGLVAAAFYFPGYAGYANITKENQAKSLSPIEFPNWILTQFATVEEVKAGLQSVVIAPTILKSWGPTPPPMHYIVYDQSGKSIVIEPVKGSLIVHENLIGTITNSPTFDWHITNLNNFINLTPFNAESKTLLGLKLTSFGQGSGMVGLPGDFTPPSRFVRAAIFSAAAAPSKTSVELVDQTFHILNQFDIPLGAVREKSQGKVSYDSTQLTSVKEAKTLKYYYKTYEDQEIKFVDLNQFDLNAKTIKKMEVKGKQKSLDVSSMLR